MEPVDFDQYPRFVNGAPRAMTVTPIVTGANAHRSDDWWVYNSHTILMEGLYQIIGNYTGWSR